MYGVTACSRIASVVSALRSSPLARPSRSRVPQVAEKRYLSTASRSERSERGETGKSERSALRSIK